MTRVRVYRASLDDLAPADPLARAGAAATALRAPDPELERVRTVLCALRPDHPDPWEPMPAAPPVAHLHVAHTRAPWDVDLPRGLVSGLGAALARAESLQVESAAEVLARIGAMPADAACVLRWMRRHASLASGIRGLWVDAGMAFASAAQATAWEDLTVRRAFAPQHGRHLVLAACAAWLGQGRQERQEGGR